MWEGGRIPSGLRDEFLFSAQAPTSAQTLFWKAYQTYVNGSVVSWDQAPNKGQADFSSFGPYSQTQVIDDLQTQQEPERSDNTTLPLSILSLGVSSAALATALKKKIHN